MLLSAAINPLDASSVIAATGLIGIFIVLIAETGLLIGFFLPGDSLLFTAGLLAASSGPAHLPLAAVLIVAPAGALIGAQIGFSIGRLLGPRLIEQRRSAALRRGMERVTEAMNRYGPARAVVLARFIPVVRTVMNPMAAVIGMNARKFLLWQVIGGLVWTVGVVLAGFWLGSQIPGIDRYLLPIIAAVVLVSLIPVALEWRRSRRAARSSAAATGGQQ